MTGPQKGSIIDYLEHWAATTPDKCFCSFLDGSGREIDQYTYLGFHDRSRYVAEYLSTKGGIRNGQRVLLIYPSGLEIIVAFVACARIGAIPVAVCPPTPANLEKLAFVTRDCEASAALTTRKLYEAYQPYLERPLTSSISHRTLPRLVWVTTDDIRGQATLSFRNDPNPILFLQYTSGSTSDPKGVVVSHENVIHNCHATLDHVPTGVSWLPQYHDMGLIGYYLFPLITGGTNYGFSPMDFLKRPILWFQTLSRVGATYASAPNFGFEYCLREDKVPCSELRDLDLSPLRVMMNASEPVRAETQRRFFDKFSQCGLRRQAHVVAYGLAENTLAVTHRGKRTIAMEELCLVSCGKALSGIQVRIVNPKSRVALDDGQIGEIWVAGKSKCVGYWNRPELTRELFSNVVANDPADQNFYLRTGDLGFIDNGELFVCGRIKDVIIIRGVNYYPQDIEAVVEAASPKIRSGGVVAFEGNESLVVVVEIKKRNDLPDPAEIIRATQTNCNTAPDTIVFVPAGAIAKTTSGKTARQLTRQRWLNGELPAIATYVGEKEKPFSTGSLTELRNYIREILKPFNFTEHEECTLAEAGIDSLTLVMVLDYIEQLFKSHGHADLIVEIDGRLFQQLTIARLFSLLDQLDHVSEQATGGLPFVLKEIRKKNDERERNLMRQDSKLENFKRGEIRGTNRPLTSVLLTGPTGFFGPFLLSSLLRQTPFTYYALTRAPDPVRGMDRICDALRVAKLWTPELARQLESRVHVICGDIAQQNLGVPHEQWDWLSTRVQAVLHNAAVVNYVSNYEALRPHNVEGTRELLRFAYTGTEKEFHFVSSTIIFGWTAKGTSSEDDNNEQMENLDFGYAQSKWTAEQLVFAAGRQGLRIRVYRPSFLTASADGVASKDDIAIRLLAFMIDNKIAVNAANQVSFLPSHIAADNIAAIFTQRELAATTFHVTVDHYYNMMDVTRSITQQYGYTFVYYDIPDFISELKRRCTKADPLYPLLDFLTRSQQKIVAMQHKRYNNDRYREARQLSGNGGGNPSLKETVSYLMAYMIREGLIAKR